MQVREIMTKNIVSVSTDETVSQALARMKANMVHQLPLVNDGKLYGMVSLKDIVTKDINPSSTKVSSIGINTPVIDADSDVEKAVELLHKSGLRSLPVTEGGKLVGIVSEIDMLKVAKNFVKGLNMRAGEITTTAEYVSKDANIGAVKKLMLERNISRVPVMNKGEIVGIIGIFDLIRALEGKERMQARGGKLQESGTKEKLAMEKIPAEAVMHRPTIMDENKTVDEAIDMLKGNEEIILKQDGKVGVITPRDIMELFGASPKKELYVQITGMHDEGIEFKVAMDSEISKFVHKMARVDNKIEYFVLHVEKMHKQGANQKYSIRARFKTNLGLFVAHAWGRKPLDVIDDVFKNLEREILHRYGKVEDKRKQKRQKDYRYA